MNYIYLDRIFLSNDNTDKHIPQWLTWMVKINNNRMPFRNLAINTETEYRSRSLKKQNLLYLWKFGSFNAGQMVNLLLFFFHFKIKKMQILQMDNPVSNLLQKQYVNFFNRIFINAVYNLFSERLVFIINSLNINKLQMSVSHKRCHRSVQQLICIKKLIVSQIPNIAGFLLNGKISGLYYNICMVATSIQSIC